MTTHPACGKSWSGSRAEHCPVCCLTFSGAIFGDRHRVGSYSQGTRRCIPEWAMPAIGMVRSKEGVWGSGKVRDGKAIQRVNQRRQSASQAQGLTGVPDDEKEAA